MEFTPGAYLRTGSDVPPVLPFYFESNPICSVAVPYVRQQINYKDATGNVLGQDGLSFYDNYWCEVNGTTYLWESEGRETNVTAYPEGTATLDIVNCSDQTAISDCSSLGAFGTVYDLEMGITITSGSPETTIEYAIEGTQQAGSVVGSLFYALMPNILLFVIAPIMVLFGIRYLLKRLRQ